MSLWVAPAALLGVVAVGVAGRGGGAAPGVPVESSRVAAAAPTVAAREVTPAPSRRFDWPGPILRPDAGATPGEQPTHRQHGASIDALIDAHASHRVVNRFTIDDETVAQTVPGPPPWVRGNGASTRVAAQSAAG